MSSPFSKVSSAALTEFIAEMPLCWIVPHAAPEAAILMPVVAEQGPGRELASLLGHLPLSAPAVAAFAHDPRASCLFLGSNAYVSPAMAGRSDWAPTWNFVSARVTGTLVVDPALTRRSVEAVVALLEGPDGWRIDDMGTRAEQLLARIVGFRLTVDESAPRFKLGQDERPDTRAAIAAALAGIPLGEWMRRT